MKKKKIPHPKIVSRDRWLSERMELLAHEKALTKQYDRVSAERRRLPMVKIEKNYVFDGPKGKLRLKDFFDGRRQLIIYHFMFDPAWEKGCPACTSYVDALWRSVDAEPARHHIRAGFSGFASQAQGL